MKAEFSHNKYVIDIHVDDMKSASRILRDDIGPARTATSGWAGPAGSADGMSIDFDCERGVRKPGFREDALTPATQPSEIVLIVQLFLHDLATFLISRGRFA